MSALLAAAGSAAGAAQAPGPRAPAADASPATVLRAARLIDVRAGLAVEDAAVVIRDGRIVSAGPASAARPPDGAKVVDLGAWTVLPGLIDAHVHLAWKPDGGSPEGAAMPPGAEEALATLRAGFTTVRNLGSTGMADVALRDAVRAGKLPGPRILAAGPALGPEGGVCDGVFAGEGVADGAEAAARRASEIAAAGADVLKLCAGGGVLPSPRDQEAREYDEAAIRAVVAAARARGLKVAAHAQGPPAIQAAVRAGVDSIEHGGLVDDETALLMKEEGVRLVPTLYRLDWTVENARAGGAEAAVVERLSAARDAAMARARRAFELGVPVVLGTDATVVPHGLNAREAAVYAKLGMKPAGVLRAATLDAAALLGLEGRLGALEPGLFADVIAVEGNPLDDVGALEHVRFVMKEGVVHRDDREHAPSGKAGAPGAPRTPE